MTAPNVAGIWSTPNRAAAMAVAVETLGADGSKMRRKRRRGRNCRQPTSPDAGSAWMAGMLEATREMFTFGVQGYADDRFTPWHRTELRRRQNTLSVVVLHGRSRRHRPAPHTRHGVDRREAAMVPALGHFSIAGQVLPVLKSLSSANEVKKVFKGSDRQPRRNRDSNCARGGRARCESVAVYAAVDALSLHTRVATASRPLAGDGVRAYLDVDASSRPRWRPAAMRAPGYGFLAENAAFAGACKAAGSRSSVRQPTRSICSATSSGPRAGAFSGFQWCPAAPHRCVLPTKRSRWHAISATGDFEGCGRWRRPRRPGCRRWHKCQGADALPERGRAAFGDGAVRRETRRPPASHRSTDTGRRGR